MTRIRSIGIAMVAMLLCVACSAPLPTAPTRTTALASASPSSTASASVALSIAQVDCTVDIGETNRPLPALHVLAGWINASLAASSLTCGQVRSPAAQLQQIVAALDQESQNFPAACGMSTSLVAEISALESTGQLAQRSFPAPVPGAPTTVLGLAELTNEHFCVAARE